MNYISTRSSNISIPFSDVLLSSTASGGGLYVPEHYPDVSGRLDEFGKLSYTELAYEILKRYTDAEIEDESLKEIIEKSYAGFSNDDVAPIIEMGNIMLVELFHGPTLAFKDFALQLLGNLFNYLLEKRNARLTLVGATSGDTGSAAIHGVKGKNNINLFMIHPHNRISRIQKLQMTSVKEPNIFNIAITGTFDDGQQIIKDIFSDEAFCREYAVGSVNSINWGRIAAQIVYYFYAGLRFMKQFPEKPLIFSVPTGNFGNIFAGYAALKMGLPIDKLICASNANDILYRALKTGQYKTGTVQKTLSPSMDIQVSSNFERLIFEITGRDSNLVKAMYADLKTQGSFEIKPEHLKKINETFSGESATDEETMNTIKNIYRNYGYICDPHTAVGIHCANIHRKESFIALATAHYAKFPSVYSQFPEIETEVPEPIKKLIDQEALYKKLPATAEGIRKYIVHALEN